MASNSFYKNWGWPEMENILQCPICLELPYGPILMCIKGHHICISCQKQLAFCPLCKSHFLNETRNFAVEQLLANITVIQNKFSISNIEVGTLRSKDLTISPKAYQYPCVFCSEILLLNQDIHHASTIIHLRTEHFDNVIDYVPNVDQRATFHVKFKYLKHNTELITHKVVDIWTLGVFFISYTNFNERPYIYLRKVAPIEYAQKYTYSLKVNNIIHKSQAASCLDTLEKLASEEDCLILNPNSLTRKRILDVHITIHREN